LIFLLSKGIEVFVCGSARKEFELGAKKKQHLLRVEFQKEFSEFDRKFENVKRVSARKKIRLAQGKCEGRKSYREAAPDTIREIIRLRRRRAGRKRRTCREIAQILNDSDRYTVSGRKFTGNNVAVILHRLKAS